MSQAQRVLAVLRKEAERWKTNAELRDAKRTQVGACCRPLLRGGVKPCVPEALHTSVSVAPRSAACFDGCGGWCRGFNGIRHWASGIRAKAFGEWGAPRLDHATDPPPTYPPAPPPLPPRQVLGESLLASGYIAYLGPAPGLFRMECEARWAALLDRHAVAVGAGGRGSGRGPTWARRGPGVCTHDCGPQGHRARD